MVRMVATPPQGEYATANGKTRARADLILTLIKASRQGDDLQVRKAVEALAADERAKNHTILADRLLAQLQSGNGRHGRSAPLVSRSAAGFINVINSLLSVAITASLILLRIVESCCSFALVSVRRRRRDRS